MLFSLTGISDVTDMRCLTLWFSIGHSIHMLPCSYVCLQSVSGHHEYAMVFSVQTTNTSNWFVMFDITELRTRHECTR